MVNDEEYEDLRKWSEDLGFESSWAFNRLERRLGKNPWRRVIELYEILVGPITWMDVHRKHLVALVKCLYWLRGRNGK